MKPRVEAFVISLPRAKERHAQVAKLQRDCPLTCHVIEAVDGSQLSDQEVACVYKKNIHRPQYPFELQRGEIGAFLSHRKAWAAIVERNLDAGLILEDDIELEVPGFANSFQLAIENLTLQSYIQFRVFWGEQHPRKPASMSPTSIVPLGATSQLVGREAARRLLKCTEQFDRPIDTFVQMKWLSQIETHVVSPSYVAEISRNLGGTTVRQKSRSLLSRLHRNLMRPVYRAKLWVYSYWHQKKLLGTSQEFTSMSESRAT
jgi:GR25 family glycosyltransferase involved in LPS biosynthesis